MWESVTKTLTRPWFQVGICLWIVLWISACSPNNPPISSGSLNSYYTDEQPSLSGDGRFLAFVSNRDARRSLLMYDLHNHRLVDLPKLNGKDSIAKTPSLSYTGRYLVYVASDRGRPEIALYDRVTQRTQILTNGYRGGVQHPSISADGRYVVFETDRRGQWDIEILDRGANIELDLRDG